MYSWLRTPLFLLNPELAHELAMKSLSASLSSKATWEATREMLFLGAPEQPELGAHVFGLDFPNRVGLAAGFDKNAEYLRPLAALGFGFIEIGTVTGLPQPGNPRPRLFRLPKDEALLNRMGFNNDGAEAVARRLDATLARWDGPRPLLGINIGKTKVVPLDEAASDYVLSLRHLHSFADYLVVNVSSPNTPGLRELQEKEPLGRLLGEIQEENHSQSSKLGVPPKPLLLKIAPDLERGALEDIVEVATQCNLAGLIATNTTISREYLKTDTAELGSGGVSGRPLVQRSREIVRELRGMTDLPIIGVGGIFKPEDSLAMFDAGAELCQVWTGFIYEGPRMVKRLVQAGSVRLYTGD